MMPLAMRVIGLGAGAGKGMPRPVSRRAEAEVCSEAPGKKVRVGPSRLGPNSCDGVICTQQQGGGALRPATGHVGHGRQSRMELEQAHQIRAADVQTISQFREGPWMGDILCQQAHTRHDGLVDGAAPSIIGMARPLQRRGELGEDQQEAADEVGLIVRVVGRGARA